ncbi:IDEAL domain-containing protein [Lederbergia sp. NSJ-179]|uniref:IDEAL domain-containing protein n=1 Tax=Lederbergia sp. NSJ-179 TaxID=2931402 RepID=UPI001FD1C306|nr:IDEAL domain-containing protein [Lederbergia sp. NSJ-179]MCJ7840393.1 IDEAL domain-containing protein [Lederbergia sp. NSJ-179]
MEKRKSYQELLKEYTMTQNKNNTQEMQWYVEFLLNDLLQQRHERELRAAIDQALDQNDRKAFKRLSKELNDLVGY